MTSLSHPRTWREMAEKMAAVFQAVAPLCTRLIVGYAFFRTGLGKWVHFDRTTEFFADLGIPAPALQAGITATLELVGGIALALGLGSRLAAFGLAITMVVALATAEQQTLLEAAVPGGAIGLLEVPALVFLMLLMWVVARGPGRLSLDHLILRWATARRRAAAAAVRERTRIVILGGGFGGLYTALELERIFDDDPDIEITLVNQDNFFLFTPMLHEVAASDLDFTAIVSPLRKHLRRTQFFHGEVIDVDVAGRSVLVRHGEADHHPHRLPYDHLVLGLGSVSNFHGLPGVAQGAFTMRTLGDAIALRNRVIASMEEADLECAQGGRERHLTFVVAGGGFAGVETIAGINDFARETREFYPNLRDSDIRMVLVHSGDRILPELSEKLGRYAQGKLAERGVEIRLGARVKALTEAGVELSDGTLIPGRTLVWTAGTTAHPLLEALPCERARGRVVVQPDLSVPGFPGVWALGDCAQVPDLARGGFCPPTAQHASRQGTTLGRNIAADIRGGRRRPFRFRMLGQLAALGRRSGVAALFGMQFSGFVAWWLWRTIYLLKLPGFDRKVRVALGWSLDLFFTKDLVQCPTERAPAPEPVDETVPRLQAAARR